jgi:hypothetical protein
MFTRIGNILPESLKKSGIAAHVARAGLFEAFAAAARALLPEERRAHFRPLHLKNGTLTVACKASSVAILLRSREQDLLAALGPSSGVERLRFMLAPWR